MIQISLQSDQHFTTYKPHEIIVVNISRKKMSYLDFNLQQYNRYTVLKPSVIQAIKNGSKLLSVGIGLGYYEEYLINTHGISRSSIHCADLHLDEKWSSHTSYIFDICSPWPNLNQKYDYILFGQVIGVSAINKGGKKSQIMAEHVEKRDFSGCPLARCRRGNYSLRHHHPNSSNPVAHSAT